MQFKIGDHEFRAESLTPKKAFHVGRRLLPLVNLLQDLGPYFAGSKSFNRDDPACIGEVLEPIGRAFAQMPDDDVDYIIDTCLGVVAIQMAGGSGWAPVQVSGQLMFDWITMPMMIEIVWRVIQQNVAGFLSAAGPPG